MCIFLAYEEALLLQICQFCVVPIFLGRVFAIPVEELSWPSLVLDPYKSSAYAKAMGGMI
jgi:hypothetical protein